MGWQWWVIGGAVALALLAGAGLWVWLRRRPRRPRARRPPRLRYPVVLAHGILGFDEVRLGPGKAEYWRGIPARLRRLGADVRVARVPMVASVAARAEELARAVRSLDAPKVNIIAHSMGGLDARYAIARLGLSDRVASLTTVGTPHRGTPLADVGTHVLGEGLMLRRLVSAIGIDAGAFYDLTTSRMLGFNREVKDAARVAYGSYLAKAGSGIGLHPLLLAPHLYLRDRAGENDGLVPVSSQRWGEVLGSVDADHWAQIGWSGKFDAPAFYAEVLRELAGRGF